MSNEGKALEQNIKMKINSKILKTFFEKLKKQGKNCGEMQFKISGTIKGPDKFGNYLLKLGDKKYLLDEDLNTLSSIEFLSIIPFDSRCYIGNLGGKCVFFDTRTNDIIEIVEHENKYQAKIYGENKISDDKHFIDICKNARILGKNEKDEKLKLLFKSFLIKFLDEIKHDYNGNNKKLNEEIRKFGEACEKYIWYMIGAYKYIYEGNITKYLAGKSGLERKNLKNSKELKKKFPNLYLAMNELDDIENVIINKKGNVQGYLKKIDGKYNYINESGNLVLIYDDFKGPDKNGNVVTKKEEKYYFLNGNFEYPFFGFDKIEGPDNNLNYIGKFKDKYCLIVGNTGKVLAINNDSPTNKKREPDIKNECFKIIEGPDKNKNYIVKTLGGFDSYLVNESGKIISKPYFKIELEDKNGIYNVLSIQGNLKIDKNGEEIK